MSKGHGMAQLLYFARKRRWVIVLALLVSALVFVYWRMLWSHEATIASRQNKLPEVAKLLARNRGKPLAFPVLLVLDRMASRRARMTTHQRQAMAMKRRAALEAFFLAYAKAPPTQQRAMIQQTQELLAMTHTKIKLSHVSKTIANALIHGNPQMNASVLQFLVALRNIK